KDGTRGHCFSHGRSYPLINNVEFKNTGRSKNAAFNETQPTNFSGTVTHIGTNQRGRYGGWHFHHNMGPARTSAEQADSSVYQFVAKGCSVWNEDLADPNNLPRWAFTMHGGEASYGLIQNNVVYNL